MRFLSWLDGLKPDSSPRRTKRGEVRGPRPDGANVVFADGSVHFLNASIDIRVFARLVTRAGIELSDFPSVLSDNPTALFRFFPTEDKLIQRFHVQLLEL